MPTPKKQGRGLDAILGGIDISDLSTSPRVSVTTNICAIPIAEIEPNPNQPRKDFDAEALNELAQSIKHQGIITPITVRKMPNGKYQIISGERRYRAAQIAELTELPAYVRVATDSQMMEMALVENIQREELSTMEIAFSYKALIEECHLTHEQLSEHVGKNRATITNYLRLLNLPAETQLALNTDQISMAHARALLGVEDAEKHIAILHDIINKHLSVRQTEQLVKASKEEKKPVVNPNKEQLPTFHAESKKDLSDTLQSVVDIRRSRRGKGTLTIHFNNDQDFERIIKLLKK